MPKRPPSAPPSPLPARRTVSTRRTLLTWAAGALAFLLSLVVTVYGLVLLNSIYPVLGALLFLAGVVPALVLAAYGVSALRAMAASQ